MESQGRGLKVKYCNFKLIFLNKKNPSFEQTLQLTTEFQNMEKALLQLEWEWGPSALSGSAVLPPPTESSLLLNQGGRGPE